MTDVHPETAAEDLGFRFKTKKSGEVVVLHHGNVARRCGIDAHDLEITIYETPCSNWGIRGVPGDELAIAYDVDV